MKYFTPLTFFCFVALLGFALAGGYGPYSRSYGFETKQIHPSYGHYGYYGHGPGVGYSHRYEHRIIPHGHYGPQYVSTGLKYEIGGYGHGFGHGYGHGYGLY